MQDLLLHQLETKLSDFCNVVFLVDFKTKMRFNGSVVIAALAALASATPTRENNIRGDEASCTCGSDMLQRSFEKCVYYNVESSPSCQADEACVYEQTISCGKSK